jgi:hypothetical protein
MRYRSVSPFPDELTKRFWAAAEASSPGHGGIAKVHRATGISRNTIVQGQRDLANPSPDPDAIGKRLRKTGGGLKKTVEQDATLRHDLEALIEPVTRGDPESPLRWTAKSLRLLAEELKKSDHQVSHRLVAELLHDMGYSLQANRKSFEANELGLPIIMRHFPPGTSKWNQT